MDAFVVACEEEGSFPCLIVDEANVALEAPDPEARDRTLMALRLLTEYTKERKRLNVILAASDYSEPCRLAALGFKSDHFTDTVLMPEVSPKEMHELLERKWGMGANLATAFMSVWGGHIWAAVKGIARLASDKDAFPAIENPITFSKDARRGAAYCVQAEEALKVEHMNEMLREVVVRGFAPFKAEGDLRAKLISERNVGGVVTQETRAPGVPIEAWEGSPDTLVVATNQAMRMMLASRLHAEK